METDKIKIRNAYFEHAVYEYYTMRNFKTAFELFLTAAEMGHLSASISAGILYEFGFGTYVSYKDAIEWYCKAKILGSTGVDPYLERCIKKSQSKICVFISGTKKYNKYD
jgi:TPR repeat protein